MTYNDTFLSISLHVSLSFPVSPSLILVSLSCGTIGVFLGDFYYVVLAVSRTRM